MTEIASLAELTDSEARRTDGGIVFIPFIAVTAVLIYAASQNSGGVA